MDDRLKLLLCRYGIRDLRRCILLVGAGISANGVRLDGSGLPTWHALCQTMIDDLFFLGRISNEDAERLTQSLELGGSNALLNVASIYKEKTDDAEFDSFFKQTLDPEDLRPSRLHHTITAIGFRAIATTNFDRLLELSSPRLHTFSCPDVLGRGDLPQLSETYLLKLHGSIYPPINLKSSIILSRDDYDSMQQDTRYHHLLRAVISGNPVLAIGYSCDDPDFLRVMDDLQRDHTVGPFVYVLLRQPSIDAIQRLRGSNLKVIPYEEHGDVARFFDQCLEEIRPTPKQPTGKTEPAATSLQPGLPVDLRGAISSGSPSLDLALGTGGWPRGHISEIWGPSGSGKTTLIMSAIAQAQKLGGNGFILDADHATHPVIAKRLGVDVDRVYYSAPESMEHAFSIVERVLRDNLFDIVAIDSLAALVPKHVLDAEIGDSGHEQDSRHQHLVRNALKLFVYTLSKSRAALLVTNQVVEKVGVMFGSPETVPWETKPIEYYASLRIDLRSISTLKDGETAIGRRVRAKVLKSRFAPPFRTAEFDCLFETGLCYESDLIDLALEAKVLSRAGAWFSYNQNALAQGRQALVHYLTQQPEIAAEIAERTFSLHGTSGGQPGAKKDLEAAAPREKTRGASKMRTANGHKKRSKTSSRKD